MTRFDRDAYIDRLRKAYLEAMKAARDQGVSIGNGYRDDDAAEKNRAVDAAQQELIDAIYALPVELDRAKLKERAA